MGAATAGFQVGYESPSQFSCAYRRLFGPADPRRLPGPPTSDGGSGKNGGVLVYRHRPPVSELSLGQDIRSRAMQDIEEKGIVRPADRRPALIMRIAAGVLLALAVIAGASPSRTQETGMTADQRYVGMWVTADGRIRHELLPNGRYDEARGPRRSAYQGRYTITGNHIDYVDDTGFTADGDFVDDVLHHGGMILRRER
jgi:hypothetical protein